MSTETEPEKQPERGPEGGPAAGPPGAVHRGIALGLAALLVAVGVFAWASAESPGPAVLALIGFWIAAWCLALAATRSTTRRFTLRVMATHFALGLAVIVLELPVLVGFDYRMALGTAPIWPSRNPQYLRDDELHYIARPHWEEVGDAGPGNIWVMRDVPDPQTYAFDVRYDERGFRNPEALDQADIAVVGDSFVLAAYVPVDQAVPAELARATGRTAYNLGQAGYGPRRELTVLRRFALPLEPKVVVWLFYEGNDLRDLPTFDRISEDFDGAFAERHGILARSFVRNALERVVLSFGKPRPNATGRSGWFERDGERHRVYFMHEPGTLTPEDEAALDEVGVILRDAVVDCEAAGARLVVGFVPGKYRALRDVLEIEEGSEAAGWSPNDLPERLGTIVRGLGENAAYVDLTPAMAAQAATGELPYYRDDTHWSPAGCRAAAEALLPAVRAALE